MDLSQAISWDIISVIGKGGSCTVFKARIKSSTQNIPTLDGDDENNYIAIKQVDIETMNKNQIEAIQAEIDIMKHLSHPNIVQYYFNKQEVMSHRINILMEYALYGSIRQFYHKQGKLNTYEIVYCLHAILAGLAYLHDNGFAHRDIKAANCLLFHPGVVKLADFGASKKFESESIVSGLKGTPNWMAPEVSILIIYLLIFKINALYQFAGNQRNTNDQRLDESRCLELRMHGSRNANWQGSLCRV